MKNFLYLFFYVVILVLDSQFLEWSMSIDRLIENTKSEIEELFKNLKDPIRNAVGIKSNDLAKVELGKNEIESIRKESDPDKQHDLAMRLILKRLYWNCGVGAILKPLNSMGSEHIFDGELNKLGTGMKDPEIVLDVANSIYATLCQNASADEVSEELTGALIHFSAKITHSSASGGVMISNERKVDLPYIFSATLQNEFGPLDLDRYSAAKNVLPNKAIGIMNSRPVQPKDAIDHMIVNAVASMPTGPVVEFVCPFLKQIMVPKGEEGEYVTLSPMSASGIMRLIGEASLKQVMTKKGNAIEVPAFSAQKIKMPVGGNKPNNVSAASKETLQNAYLFETPERNYSLRRVYSIVMRGYSVLIDKGLAGSIIEYNRHKEESSKDTISARNFEKSGTPIVGLVKDVCERLKNDIDLVDQAKAIIGEGRFLEKLKSMTESNPPSKIVTAILDGKFDEDAIDSVINAIFSQLKGAFKDAMVAYPDPTASRHKEIIREVLVRNLPCTK